MKYIVVTGGVISGLGKGITIASIGRILKSSNTRVTAIKVDPYLNVDAGTMSPLEHGETFILDDGGETDLDLGNYERFLDVTLTARHNITSGKIYKEVLKRERRGDYLGKTVQMVPHVTDMVQSWLKEVSKIPVDGTGCSPDVCLVEVGGTVGDIESMIFLEALRQFQFTIGRENILFIHVSLVPVTGGEAKSKPTQHSVKELRALGLSPDIIVCRAPEELSLGIKQKISTFCHVSPHHIISNYDVKNIYHVPLVLQQQGLHTIIRQMLHLEEVMSSEPELQSWRDLAESADNTSPKVDIGIVGKYISHSDSYLSLVVAIKHAAILLQCDVVIHWIEATDLEEGTKLSRSVDYNTAWEVLQKMDGILIPGGFGVRGIEGKVAAARYSRTHNIPCLGICLGMQVMVIEYARSVLQWTQANSVEFDEATSKPVVIFMPEINQHEMGGTMRLGVRGTTIVPRYSHETSHGAVTFAARVYGVDIEANDSSAVVFERHRHRYEVNPEYVTTLEDAGLVFSGKDESQGVRMEIVELPSEVHPFYFGVQYHPEVKSRPTRPSPPIFAFCCASAKKKTQIELGRAGRLWQEHAESMFGGHATHSTAEAAISPASLNTSNGGGDGSVANRLLVTRKRSISEAAGPNTALMSSPKKQNI